jgi:hypothetical protein
MREYLTTAVVRRAGDTQALAVLRSGGLGAMVLFSAQILEL